MKQSFLAVLLGFSAITAFASEKISLAKQATYKGFYVQAIHSDNEMLFKKTLGTRYSMHVFFRDAKRTSNPSFYAKSIHFIDGLNSIESLLQTAFISNSAVNFEVNESGEIISVTISKED